MDASSTQMALVVDYDERLIGAVTDGDIRRGLLSGYGLESPVELCMNSSPSSMPSSATPAQILLTMRKLGIRQMPLLDDAGRVTDLILMEALSSAPQRDNEVVLMVGGLGTRLGDLTKDTPKPMLPVGGKPLLEHIVNSFIDQGFCKFWFAVNYLSNIIEDHFGDGSKMGCEIRYLREDKRMGTAGALSLLPERPTLPFIVSNGDLLAKLSLGAMLDRHDQASAEATMAVREYDVQVPFGVVRVDGGMMVGFDEKPVHRHMICSGLYVLSPDVLSRIPRDQFFDMPQLFQRVVDDGGRAAVHRFDGYWLDIGRLSDYDQALSDFHEAGLS